MMADPLAGARASLRERVRRERARLLRRVYPVLELAHDPVAFAMDALGFEPWDMQAEWMRAVAPENSAVSVASGHKTGKSTGAASVCLWFWGTRRRARVILMAPKVEHVEVVLWPEIRRFYLSAGRCADCSKRIEEEPHKALPACDFCSPLGDPKWIGMDPTKGLRSPDGAREIFAYTARKPDAVGGLSGPEMLFVFDEASGIDNLVFEAMSGNAAGGVRKLLLGNPLRTVGEFYDSHHSGKRFYTYSAQISSEDTPNVRAGEKLIPGLATRGWCDECVEKWGADSVLYSVRVKGEFPRYEPGQLVPADVLEDAEERWATTEGTGRLQIGVDVAFTGDDAAIAPARGQKILELTAFTGFDEEGLAAHVVGAARAHRLSHERKPLVVYDSNGVGAKLGVALRQYEEEIDCVGVSGIAKPRRPREFHQLRDEVACNFATWLKTGALPTDLKLQGEIMHTRAFDAGGGRRRVISNDVLRKALGRSPDRRNACELAVWDVRALDAYEDAPALANVATIVQSVTRSDPDPVHPRSSSGTINPYTGGIDAYGGWGMRR